MSDWLKNLLDRIRPLTSIPDAAAETAKAIEEELKSTDDIGNKVAAIGQDLQNFATEVEDAFKANTAPAP